MMDNTKLLLIGQAASGKSTLSRALAQRLALPCYRIDDYRRWLGDNSIAADYRVRAAFLDACSRTSLGIFEFSAVGHHRSAVRLAMKEQRTQLTIVNVECDETTRQARLAQRNYDTPYPNWGVGPAFAAAQEAHSLKQDTVDAFWTTVPNWMQIQVRGDEPVEHALDIIIGHLSVPPKAPVAEAAKLSVASAEWMADVLRLPVSNFGPVGARPAFESTVGETWEISSPEVDTIKLQDLLVALRHVGWHALIAPAELNLTRLSALSPDLERYVEIRVCQCYEASAASCAADFVVQLERASAARAASDATAWFFGASAALRSLTQCWAHAQNNNTADCPSSPAIQLPSHLKPLYRDCAPSLHLAYGTLEADRIYNFANAVLADIRKHEHAALAVATLDSWLPVLRSIFDTRDALWNFRDVASSTSGHLRNGVLFRGSSPTRYHHDPRYTGYGLFERWRHATGVSLVIDLRTTTEADASPYPIEWLSQLAVKHHPTDGHLLQQRGEISPELAHEYLAFFEAYPAVFKSAALCIAEAEQSVLVHCFTGVYRTGVVIAVLCYLCCIPRALIIRDYLAYGESAHLQCIEIILDRLELIGNAQAVARHLDIDDTCLSAFRKRIQV